VPSAPHLVAAIDHGTSSTRCLLFDRDGLVVAMHQLEQTVSTPRPGWVELDMAEVWQHTQECVAGALAAAGAAAADVAAVGIANQRESAVLWERASGRPVGPSLVWQDTRTAAAAAALAAQGGVDRFRDRTGLPISTYSTALKLQWLLDAEPGRRAAAERGELLFGTPDTWLLWNLTGGPRGGVHATEPSNASRTLLMNIASLRWDAELIELMRIPPALLPEIRSSSENFGAARGELAGVPVAGLLGDQQAALLGHGCTNPGESKCTYGTGAFLLQNVGVEAVRSRHGLITTVAWQLGDAPPVYALEGSVAAAGAVIQWLRDELGLIEHAADAEELARSVPDSGGVVFVPAFSGLYAPHWRGDARGLIAGLTRHTGAGHIARAALEACAFQIVEVVDAMLADTGLSELAELRVDGGMTGNSLLMQLQADLLGRPIVVPEDAEMTAAGAAYAAGLATGFWSEEALPARRRTARRFEPSSNEESRRRRMERWRQGVARSLDWADPIDYPSA
jgi:glycerol kinase